jgi:hypothetical protein
MRLRLVEAEDDAHGADVSPQFENVALDAGLVIDHLFSALDRILACLARRLEDVLDLVAEIGEHLARDEFRDLDWLGALALRALHKIIPASASKANRGGEACRR